MRLLAVFLVMPWLSAQQAPGPTPLPRPLKLMAAPMGPREMLKAMLALERARRTEPGATVEVIGHDDEAALKLLGMKVAKEVRLQFRTTDKAQHRELRAFMQQDPSRPAPFLFVPKLPGP